ncbi:MAG: transcription-repair coupling factor [Fimbriimonadaceae bacterium]|nr:transcription-repair coupling factor [Fimbriimonadaceae bacterium]NUM37994.1 transcription-repair coupling factor [Armatimonadota bacterium]
MRAADWSRALGELFPIAQPGSASRRTVAWESICGEARPVLLAGAYLASPRKTLVIVPNVDRALKWQAKLLLCGVSRESVRTLPNGLTALFDDDPPEFVALSDRIAALQALADDDPVIVVATASAALERTLPAHVLREVTFTLKPGVRIEPQALTRRLLKLGYEHHEPVRLPGHFSRRGGIIDVFVMGLDCPVRIEMFGNEVESLRSFDSVTQRSISKVPGVSFAPSRETLLPSDSGQFVDMLRRSLELEAAALEATYRDSLIEHIEEDVRRFESREYFDRLDLYRPLIHPDACGVVDLIGGDGLVVLDEPLEVEIAALKAQEEMDQALKSRSSRGEMLQGYVSDFLAPVEHLAENVPVLAMGSMNAYPDWLTPDERVAVEANSLSSLHGSPTGLTKSLKQWKSSNHRIVFATDQANRSKAVLAKVDFFPQPVESLDGLGELKPGVYLSQGNLAGGFALPQHQVTVVTDAELFGVARLRLPQKRFLEGSPVTTLLDLKAGDFVVHIQFGIGRYHGLAKRSVDGVEKEFLFLEYAAGDKLFVPTDQLDRVQKYLNPGDIEPKVNRLRGTEWQKTISKAREDARKVAAELIRLYAQRTLVHRRQYGPDTPWQQEMEATFPWVETPSQLAAIKDVKRDLAQAWPMDRLICGDVGYGKTEVALRAAFKAVQDGRQVAVMCPTTILSEQHFRNFQERLGPFDVKIELLNRFRKASERRETLAMLKSGDAEIVIGTHALLSQEIVFKNLGLLIVDEEQKFGVKQKETLKKLRVEVDVLSMSATPIPRTLSMALMDLRQMSLINDPPPGRLPVRTVVRPYSAESVREAILRELSRGGQVFYVFNRVQGIYHVAEKLRKLVPTARIGVGHGQMAESELEPVMMGFLEGEIDVLLSTTIIENGLDIANANTLIVENADRFGLSQLYQLRGRVGRSDSQAYALFFFHPVRDMDDDALARLRAIQEFADLGAGYSLAFRDLQIRGAGEILGTRQHGSMASVGYELYTQLIQEAVSEERAKLLDPSHQGGEGEPESAKLEPLPTLDIPVAALIPESYIPVAAQRLHYYQRIVVSPSSEVLAEVGAEIEDRYGHPPDTVRAMMRVVRCRIAMRDIGISKVEGSGGRLAISFADRAAISPMVWSLLSKRVRECYFSQTQLIWPFSGDALAATERMIAEMQAVIEQVELVSAAD